MTRKADKDEELKGHLAGGEELAVLFYSAWCPYCSAFLPAFDACAARRPERFLRACTDAMETAEDAHSIEVVPTVIYFKKGKAAARLDGIRGKGLTEAMLASFLKDCGLE